MSPNSQINYLNTIQMKNGNIFPKGARLTCQIGRHMTDFTGDDSVKTNAGPLRGYV